MEGKGRGKRLISMFSNLSKVEKERGLVAEEPKEVNIIEEKGVFEDAQEDQLKENRAGDYDEWGVTDTKISNLPRKASIESQSSIDSDTGCICNRNREWITCDSCGFQYEGRVRKKCSIHQNVIHLMDVVYCSKCGARFEK